MRSILLLFLFLFFIQIPTEARSMAFVQEFMQKSDLTPDIDLFKPIIITGTNWVPYYSYLDVKIRKNSKYQSENKEVFELAYMIVLDKEGNVLDYKITKSSGDIKQDESILEAIRTIGKFKPLPEEYKGEIVRINHVMDFNAYLPKTDSITLYTKAVGDKISKNYTSNLRTNLKPYEMIVTIEILKDGSLKSAVIKQSCGNKREDEELIKAIYKSSPFDKLPEDFKENSLIFDSKFYSRLYWPSY